MFHLFFCFAFNLNCTESLLFMVGFTQHHPGVAKAMASLTCMCCLCRFVQSWIEGRDVQSEKANLIILFERYIPPILDVLRSRFKKITPVTESSMIQTLCYLLEVLLTPENTPLDCPKEWYELYFVFAAVWAFGGAMFQDQVSVLDVGDSSIFSTEVVLL